MQRRRTSWVILLLASTIIVLLWEVQSIQAATAQDIANLRSMASVLGIPQGVWNFSTDPCAGRWRGVSCCSNNSQSSCCQFPLQVYPPQVVACDTTEDAQISMLLLRSDIIGDRLNGSMTDSICSISSLVALDLGLNRLRGQIPPCIGNLGALQILRLGGNDLNGSIPQELGNLNQLRQLFLDTTMISGAIPPSLGRLSNLQNLVLRSNALEGNIPPEIGQLGSLQDLELQVNKLSGSIPASFKKLTRLTTLLLFNNELTGELNVFQDMTVLKTLSLRDNGFTGSVPEFQLPRLAQLDLGFNQLTGGIPDSLGSISALQGIFLGHNRLSGGIPPSLTSLLTISYLDISHNLLDGSLENLTPIGTANQLGAQIDVSFNFFDISSAPKGSIQPQDQQQSFFNCIPSAPSRACSQSSPGRSRIFAVNAGGNALPNNRIPFDADVSSTNQSLGLFYGGRSWALELSGTSAGSYTRQVPVNMANSSGDSPDLYTSMRWSSSYIAYHGFGLEPGTYTVSIHFAEIVFKEPGYRMFDVLVQGQVVKKGLDVVKEVGANTAYKITKNTTVNNGSVSVEFIFAGPDRYLLPGSWDVESLGPMVSAISVVSLEYSGETGSSSLSSGKIAGIAVGSALGGIFIILCILLCRKRKQRTIANEQAGSGGGGSANQQSSSRASELNIAGPFSYQDLNEATKGFSEKLGEGGFGAVYKGTLPTGLVIAVKQLLKRNKQIEEDFKKEISIISKVRHRNLLAIYGYSLESEIPMLVTEYMPNGSLDRWLFQRQRENALSWETRRNIAVGVACGLAYLHDESNYRIIHLDVKPANILLDTDFNPRIADFGLARLYDEKQSHVTATRLKGTAGYLAPEYAMHLQLSDKVDVYSFGVVLLEILSGRRAVNFAAPSEQAVLVDWAHKEAEVPSNLLDILDKKLHGQYVEEEAKDMVTIAILCTQRSPTLRPKMQSVWLMLNGTIKVPAFLENLNAVIQSASSESSSGTAIPETSFSEGFTSVRRFPENSTSFSSSSQPVTW